METWQFYCFILVRNSKNYFVGRNIISGQGEQGWEGKDVLHINCCHICHKWLNGSNLSTGDINGVLNPNCIVYDLWPHVSANVSINLKIPLGGSFFARTPCRIRNGPKLGRYLLNSVFFIRVTVMITVGIIFVLKFFVLLKYFIKSVRKIVVLNYSWCKFLLLGDFFSEKDSIKTSQNFIVEGLI